MIFEQHYLECLSQASYLIGDPTSGRAVVVDPRRDISAYLASAAEHGLTIELVIETHFHADFLSGHLELAAATGATIAYGSLAETEFASRKLADGERIELGDVVLEIRHTPGHTPESISVVVYEHAGDAEPFAVLTGDTLFIGDVGRPDLLSSKGVTSEELGGMLYDSLHDKLMIAARRHPGVPGPRCRVVVRQEPLDRHVVDDRRAAGDQLRRAGDAQGGLRRRRHRRADGTAGVLLVRCRAQPRAPRAARRDVGAAGDGARRRAAPAALGRRRPRHPRPERVRRRAPRRGDQRRARRALRRVRRRGDPARRADHPRHRCRQWSGRPRTAWPASASTASSGTSPIRCSPSSPIRRRSSGAPASTSTSSSNGWPATPICNSSTSASRARPPTA